MHLDPASPPEPLVYPPPFLRPYDKALIDENYMSFYVVWQRLWPLYLHEPLEAFCREQGPHIFHKELLCNEVRRLMVSWTTPAAVVEMREFRMEAGDPWWGRSYEQMQMEQQAKLEYERRVRCWHVQRHVAMYENWAAGELRKMGFLVGL
ncbi:MAG: hypothetical protein LQ338_004732 [Usnochroma carphineum]|nr:MAG: hypothetical protein LQ338_004732 [Usnochroma carphineum]